MERLRVRSRNGPARDDPVRHPRHPPLCAKRPAVSPPVRMKFSVNWLREFVDLPENPEEIADLLTRAGVETQNIETRGARIDKVIVSQITASSRHPNADRLTVCEVDDGSGTKRQIVCGATNYKVGDKVPLALPGTKLPNGTEIRKSKLRGVESEGMLCSAIELGMGSDAAGLLILSPEAKVGAPISDLFPSDTILDVEVTPNRGDLLSHFGLAREFLAFDGKTYSLKPDNCVVADQERAVGIGGVMGGEETGVTESTKSVLLEAAYFFPASIRKTARELSLPSDASYRFERGVDPEMVLPASQRATELIQEIASGTPAKEIHIDGKLPANPADVSLTYEKCDRVVGIALKPKTVDEILTGFGLKKTSAAKTTKWKIPSYRRDLQRDVDLIEEVVRAYGANKIPGTNRSRFTPSSAADDSHDLESAFRERLSAQGLWEVRTSKLIPRSAAAASSAIQLRNPLTEDHVALRPNLISGLLAVLDRNVRAGAERVAIFEIGRIFLPPRANEHKHLGILLWGNATSAPHWRLQQNYRFDCFD